MDLGPASERRLAGVHPDLIRVVLRAAEIAGALRFIVTEGLRSPGRQAALVLAGKSATQRSRHLTGHAVDLAVMDGDTITWEFPRYRQLADVMGLAAETERVPIEWGGAWTHLRDGPHFQLPWEKYPLPEPGSGQSVA